MRRAALLLAALAALAASPAQAAETPDDAAVLAAFRALMGEGEARRFFALPEAAYWKAAGPLTVALESPTPEKHRRALRTASEAFAVASGLDIRLAEAGDEAALTVQVGPVEELAERAAATGAHPGVVRRFSDATWPFAFAIDRENGLAATVFVASRTREEAVDASFVLALVWALGGATLGGELEGLVEPQDGRPGLTPLGRAVFALMYHPRLERGLPLAEAEARARAVLARD